MTWYVATMDTDPEAFPDRERAVKHILALNQDGRARPRFKRIAFRLYEYTPPRDAERERTSTYYLGDRASMERQGFHCPRGDEESE